MKVISLDSERRLEQRHGIASELYVPDKNVADDLFDGREVTTALQVTDSHALNERYRQCIIRRTCSSLEPIEMPALQLPLVLPLDIESIPGDYWSGILRGFLCQSPGFYNIKAACDVHARIYESGPASWVALQLLINDVKYNTPIDRHYVNNLTYLGGFATQRMFLSGADKILLQAGDKLQLALVHDGATACNTGYYMTARFALQRTGDTVTQTECTC